MEQSDRPINAFVLAPPSWHTFLLIPSRKRQNEDFHRRCFPRVYRLCECMILDLELVVLADQKCFIREDPSHIYSVNDVIMVFSKNTMFLII